MTKDENFKNIEMILRWAASHPEFDTKFIQSLYDKYLSEEETSLSMAQEMAIDRIIRKWNVKEPKEDYQKIVQLYPMQKAS